jgi:hypothetical protein
MNDRLAQAESSGHWTIGALHDHIDGRFRALEKLVDTRFEAQATLVAAAKTEAERASDRAERIASYDKAQANEWRQTIGDLTQMMMPRAEYIIAQTALVEKLNDVATRQNLCEGAGKRTDTIIPWIIAAAGVATGAIVAIVSLLIDFTH